MRTGIPSPSHLPTNSVQLAYSSHLSQLGQNFNPGRTWPPTDLMIDRQTSYTIEQHCAWKDWVTERAYVFWFLTDELECSGTRNSICRQLSHLVDPPIRHKRILSTSPTLRWHHKHVNVQRAVVPRLRRNCHVYISVTWQWKYSIWIFGCNSHSSIALSHIAQQHRVTQHSITVLHSTTFLQHYSKQMFTLFDQRARVKETDNAKQSSTTHSHKAVTCTETQIALSVRNAALFIKTYFQLLMNRWTNKTN